MSFNVNYKENDSYNDKMVIRISVARQMNPKREDRFGHYIYWKNYKNGKENKCNFSSFGLNHKNNSKVIPGFNDIATIAPWMIPWFKDKSIPYTHTVQSNYKVDWICPNCGAEIRNRSISNFYNYGKVICPNCSDGISYPERFIANLLNKCDVNFKFHHCFEWSNRRFYDFYIPSFNMIIETHGKQHYTNTWSSYVDSKTSISIQDNDKYKEKLAKENGILNYIVLDCSQSDCDYIRNSIMSSILPDFINFDNIDWENIGKKSLTSVFIQVINCIKDGLTKQELMEKFKLSDYTIYRYVKRAKNIGMLKNDFSFSRKKATCSKQKKKRKILPTKDKGNNLLTKREVDVCSLAVQGYEFKEIANMLGVGYTTIVTHKKNAYKKLNISTKKELISLYQKSEYLQQTLKL